MFRHANPTRFIICRRCYPLSYKLLWFLTQFRCEHGQIQVAVLVVVVVVSYCKKNREFISTCDEKKIRHQVVFSASVQSNRQKTESSSATSKPQTVAILNFLSQRPGPYLPFLPFTFSVMTTCFWSLTAEKLDEMCHIGGAEQGNCCWVR